MPELPREVAPGVVRFCDGLANWYAIERDGGVLLVDSGWPGGREALVGGLEALGRSPGDVRAVLLTHGHPDHLGGASWLEAAHGVPVYAHREELERARGRRPDTRAPSMVLDLWRPAAIRFVAGAIRRGVTSPRWVARPRPLDELSDASIEVVLCPGHTEGHVAYLLRDRGVLLSGDALVTRSVLTGRRGPQLHPAAFSVDIEQAAASLSRLAELDADLLLPGHGDPCAGAVSGAVEQALARRAR